MKDKATDVAMKTAIALKEAQANPDLSMWDAAAIIDRETKLPEKEDLLDQFLNLPLGDLEGFARVRKWTRNLLAKGA